MSLTLMASSATPTPATKIVKCPTCGGPSVYAASNRFRPFCSERCRSIDLGAWASEEFRVPEDEPDPQAQTPDDQSS